jgi:single-stranded DNA-binding protein
LHYILSDIAFQGLAIFGLSLKTEKWGDKEGKRKQVAKVIGSKLIMLGPRKSEKDDGKFGPDDQAPF